MIGSGYVGLVSGACFADFGHAVTCVDKDPGRIDALRRGEMPIYEPGLAGLVAANARDGRLAFTADAATDAISAYSVAWNGSLSLITPGGATAQLAAGTHPLDEAISRDRFLYVNGGNSGTINAFRIAGDGSLTSLGSVAGLPAGFGGLVVGS